MNRNREQHMSDVAALALDNIDQVIQLSHVLASQVQILSNRAGEGNEALVAPLLILRGASEVFCQARESLRDLAATLPIRGLEFGE